MSKNIFKKVIDKKITRRSFLKWSSAIGATLTLSGLVVNESAATAMAGTEAGVTAAMVTDYIPSVCLVCHSWCRIAIGVDTDRVVRKIEGLGGQPKPLGTSHTNLAANGTVVTNANDDTYDRYCKADVGQLPYSTHNRGRICAKGNDGMEHMYDPDRVKYPLVRVGKRGSGKWRKVTWGELYLGDKSCAAKGSPSNQDIMIDNGSGKLMHWQGIARIMRSMGGDTNADIPTAGGLGYGYTDNSGDYYSDIPDVSTGTGHATDRRHRLLLYIGRNESGGLWGRFQKAFGTNMRIEHTNLCEESRHTANEWYCKDKFPLPNLNTNKGVITDSRSGGKWTFTDNDNCDCFIAIGGNYAESTIPHATLAQRVADVRRRGGRIIGIDVRQSNTLAYADEQFYVKPGTDGALAAGIIYEIMNSFVGGTTALKLRLDSRANIAGHYVGLFTADEGSTNPPHNGKSIETYLKDSATFGSAYGITSGNLSDGRSATGTAPFDAAAAAAICGVSVTDIKYLAWLLSGGFGAGNSLPPGGTIATDPPHSPIIDGYRGPAKHSNGAYNYGLLRALQFIACGYVDSTSISGDLSESVKRSGGFNRPGGLIQLTWNSGNTSGDTAGFGDPPGGAFDNTDGSWPLQEQAPYPALGTPQKIDNWDYHGYGGSKWRCGKHNIYSNTLVGVRASLGLDPYIEGATLSTPKANPYANSGNGYDDNFTVEAIFMHKCNAVYDLPNPAIERELFTSVGTNGYRLKHLWSCDLNMGDGTKFADAILPDSSYLERYGFNDYENGAHLKMTAIRQPAIQDLSGKNLHLYGCKPIRNILYGLARAIEADSVNDNGDSTTKGTGAPPLSANSGYAPWGGKCFNSFDWSSSTADVSDRDYEAARCNSAAAMPVSGYSTGFEYYRTNGIYEGASTEWPNFWRNDYTGHGVNTQPMDTQLAANYTAPNTSWSVNAVGNLKVGDTVVVTNTDGDSDTLIVTGVDTILNTFTTTPPGSTYAYAINDSAVANYNAVEFYHARLDLVADPTANEVGKHDNTFYGTPIYDAIRKQGAFNVSDPAIGRYNLTTYRLNVHTHARTASCPRLEEIIGSNWAVMAPGAKDINGTLIKNGDKVKVTSAHDDGIALYDASITRHIILEAKITPKISNGVMAISQSQGHDLSSFGGDGMGGQGYDVVKGTAPAIHNRADASDPSYSTVKYGALDQYRLYAAPSAPSTSYNPASRTVEPTAAKTVGLNHGTHVNWAINRGGEDPVGTSVAYMDTMVTVEKV